MDKQLAVIRSVSLNDEARLQAELTVRGEQENVFTLVGFDAVKQIVMSVRDSYNELKKDNVPGAVEFLEGRLVEVVKELGEWRIVGLVVIGPLCFEAQRTNIVNQTFVRR